MIIGTAYAVYLAADHLIRLEDDTDTDFSEPMVKYATISPIASPAMSPISSQLSNIPCLASKMAPDFLKVDGIDHFEDINGCYIKDRARNINNRPIYAKEDSTVRLWSYRLDGETQLWMISEEEHLETQNAYACVKSPAFIPTDIEDDWMSFNVIQRCFKPNEGVCIEEIKNISEDQSEFTEETKARYLELRNLERCIPSEILDDDTENFDIREMTEENHLGDLKIQIP